jgi:hypothetical protein
MHQLARQRRASTRPTGRRRGDRSGSVAGPRSLYHAMQKLGIGNRTDLQKYAVLSSQAGSPSATPRNEIRACSTNMMAATAIEHAPRTAKYVVWSAIV